MRLFLGIIILFLVGCSGDEKPQFPELSLEEIQEKLLQANKNALSIEKNQIKEYIKQKQLDVITTKTGLNYSIYHNEEGDSIRTNQEVAINYTVTLLDGTECYDTEGVAEEFTVGKDYVESGLHEAIKYLNKGDKAIIIIPSHLGHGLTGDFKKIPVRSTIVYDIEVVGVK